MRAIGVPLGGGGGGGAAPIWPRRPSAFAQWLPTGGVKFFKPRVVCRSSATAWSRSSASVGIAHRDRHDAGEYTAMVGAELVGVLRAVEVLAHLHPPRPDTAPRLRRPVVAPGGVRA